jgi:hypothetical protein
MVRVLSDELSPEFRIQHNEETDDLYGGRGV